MTIDQVLDALENDGARHLTQPCSEHEIDALEEALGFPLPLDFRVFLARVGGGILYDRHEVFGARRLMIHDIELVPGLLALRRTLESSRPGWPPHLLPIHRRGGALHLLDLSPRAAARVVGDDGRAWVDLPSFLESVVLPSRRADGVRGAAAC